MLNRLHIRNFTVFAEADFEFGPGLNVIVGTNGTGKSHVLKLGYAVGMARSNVNKTASSSIFSLVDSGSIFLWNAVLYRMLPAVFLSNQLGPLIRRGAEKPLEVEVDFEKEPAKKLSFRINLADEAAIQKTSSLEMTDGNTPLPEPEKIVVPVFIPAKEVLTLGWLLSLSDRREIPIDETYPDILRLLSGPPLKSPEPASIVDQLRQLIGGKIEEEGGRFYLFAPEQPRMEMNLVAEGMRKFAILYKLLANGTLTPETTLFWDEPEANLNPALLKQMAAILAEMARAGFQIILATHSLFLMKELHILSQQEKTPIRYFGLSALPGEATTVTAADSLELLPDIVALDAELEQSDRFQRVLDREDADRN